MFDRSIQASLIRALGVVSLVICGSGTAYTQPLVDPTRPYDWKAKSDDTGEQAEQPSDYQLQGIYNMGGVRSAVISGERVRVGDSIHDAEILAIGRDRVSMRIAGQTRDLSVSRVPVKHPAGNGEGVAATLPGFAGGQTR